MQEIAKTDSHTLAVDTTKNRIYWTVIRNNLSENSTFFRDWEKAKHLVSPGFTVLTDASQIRCISRDWVETSVKVRKILIKEGLAGIAEILSESVVEKLRIKQINRISGSCCYTKEEIITDRKIAEAWLDRISR